MSTAISMRVVRSELLGEDLSSWNYFGIYEICNNKKIYHLPYWRLHPVVEWMIDAAVAGH